MVLEQVGKGLCNLVDGGGPASLLSDEGIALAHDPLDFDSLRDVGGYVYPAKGCPIDREVVLARL